MKFMKNLIIELFTEGKMLIGYIALQLDSITSFPGLITSIKTAAHDNTKAAWIDLGVQVLMAVAATHRAGKIVVTAATK